MGDLVTNSMEKTEIFNAFFAVRATFRNLRPVKAERKYGTRKTQPQWRKIRLESI